jgi:hypothetical protein
MDDENLRVIFSSMGFLSGKTIVIKNLSLTEGGKIDVIRLSKNSKKNKLVAFPKYEEYQLLPAEYQNLILNFLWEKEADYWLDIKNYITNEIGSKALIMGTSMGCSSTMLQNCFDIIDSHAYWNHPVFPKTAWDLNHYYVANKTLTKSTIDSTLATLAKYRVYGKPFSVSEYDHPYPNQFSAEMYPMIASFASFQDWDCIFTFCSTLPTNKNGQNLKITGYFDQGNNPAKSCASPIASKIFRNFLVKPAKTNYYINLDEKTERENLHKFNSWNIGNTVIYGMIPDVSLVSKIGIAVNGNVPKNAVNLLTNAPSFSSRKTFDETNQIYWDRDSGVYIVCNQDVTITVTGKNSVLPAYPEQWKKNGILQPLTNNNDFTTMMAIKENNSYILFLCSWSGNKGENLAEYGTKGSKKIYRNEINLTTSPTLGRGPAFALGGGGKLEIYNKENLKLYQVDLSGNRINQALKTGKIIQLSPYTPTLWYILEGSHWD